MTSAVSDTGIKFGKITVDKETGRTKVTQKIEGMDLGEFFQNMKEAKSVPIKKQTDIVKLNNDKLAALEDFKTKILNLNKMTSSLTNSLGYQTQYTPNMMEKKTYSAVSNTSVPASNILGMDIYENADLGALNITVNQMATADKYSTQISAPDFSTPLNLNGAFTIGTTNQTSKATITVTPTMNLNDITAAINGVSATTQVSASYNLIQSGNPSTYEFTLSSKQLGAPIVLQDIIPAIPTTPASVPILQGWNLVPGQPVSITSGSLTANTANNLNLTGNFVISAGTGPAATINLANLSLDDLVSQIKATTSTSNISAEVVPIYPANALSSTPPSGYALKLQSTATGQPLDFSGSTSTVLNSLQLSKVTNSSINSVVSSADLITDQGLTGNLVIQAGPNGTPFSQDITGLSLNDIVAKINQSTLATGVFAKIQVLTEADPTITGSQNICQLTLATNNGEALQVNTSDANVISGLGLNSPIHDYQTMLSKITVNGVDYQRFTNSIYDAVKGVTLNLQNASPGSIVTANVARDNQAVSKGLDDFVSAFNDLNAFYSKQTAMKEDFSGPKEGALLADNQYVQKFMEQLQQTLCGSVTGTANGDLINLKSIGLQLNRVNVEGDGKVLAGDGDLSLDPSGGENSLNQALLNKLDQLIALFGNTVTNTNAEFEISAAPNIIDSSFIGKDLALTLRNDSSGVITATAILDGKTYPANVSVKGGKVTLSFEDTGTNLDDFTFDYNQLPAINTSASTTMNITSGIMAQIKGFLSDATDPNLSDDKSILPPFNIKGSLLQAIAVLQDKNKTLNENIQKMEKDVQRDLARIEASFNKVYAAKEKYNQIKMILESFQKVK